MSECSTLRPASSKNPATRGPPPTRSQRGPVFRSALSTTTSRTRTRCSYSLAERHLATGTQSLIGVFVWLRDVEPGLEESLRAVIDAIVTMHVKDGHLHHLLYDSAPRSTELEKRLHEADAAMADEVAWHLERLGVGGEHRRLVASLLVSGVEAQVHRAIIDATHPGEPAADAGVLVDVLTRLWFRALRDDNQD